MRLTALACLASVLLTAAFLRAALPAPDPDDGGIRLPPGFRAVVVADDLMSGRNGDKLRFLAVAPNGDVYAKTLNGGILALRDTNGDGRADIVKEFGEGGGTGIALHGPWLYSSTNSEVDRYPYVPGELVPSGKPERIVRDLPDGHQHNAKAFTFDGNGRLLVEVGSPSNSYGFPDREAGAKGRNATEFLRTHGGYWLFDPDKPDQTQADAHHFSTGQRHSLSIAWNPVSHSFFMAMMGRDQLNVVAPQYYDVLDNAERVAEEFHELKDGANLGWPYTYYDPYKKARMVSPEFGGDNRKRAEGDNYDPPLIAFPAHWAPMQLAFYTGAQFPAHYRHGAFLAFHGSWNRAPLPQAGYKVCFIPFNADGKPTGSYEVFADGFAGFNDSSNTNDARYRPCGLAVGPDGSLYVGETEHGRIWRIIYTGETRLAASSGQAPLPAAADQAPEDQSRGAVLYQSVCANCHMGDGRGVANMQPALLGSEVVAGDSSRLIRVLLQGPAAVLPAGRPTYQNQMPAFGNFSDADLAEVINYVRAHFGKGAAPVTAAQVSAQRSTPAP
jgi:glucose/arabinose dehydrogenase